MGISRHIDDFLAHAKWPVAAITVLLLPSSAIVALRLILTIVRDPEPMLPFLGGGLAYWLAWRRFFRRPAWGSYLSTLEHELTHALFALLTFHRVTGIRATWRRGGEMSYLGRGNWLITVSPYFFPMVSVAVACLLRLFPDGLRFWGAALLGATLAYHAISTRKETHSGQTDLQRVGPTFAWMFLPTANLLCFSALIAFAWGGGGAARAHLSEVFGHFLRMF